MTYSTNPVPIVVNWHLTEACNFSCRYCYAYWERAESVKDLIKNEHQVRALVAELGRFFGSEAATRRFGFYGVEPRLNIAGGEPLLFPSAVQAAVHQARQVGDRKSVV